MQNLRLETILAVSIALLIGLQSRCLAESYSENNNFNESLIAQYQAEHIEYKVDHASAPQPSNAPVLQGASCGTIGPQGGDAAAIMGINTASIHHPPKTETIPLVSIFLVSMLSLSLLGFGLRALLVQKRASLWVIGSVAAGALLFAGFVWAAIFSPPFVFGLSLIDQARLLYNDAVLSCL